MDIQELYNRVESELLNEEIDKSQNELYLENIEEIIYTNTPELKSELLTINCNDAEVSGYLIHDNTLRLAYLDFDPDSDNQMLGAEELIKKLQKVCGIRTAMSSIEELSESFDREDPIYDVYEAILEIKNLKLEIIVYTNKRVSELMDLMIKGLEISEDISIRLEDRNTLISHFNNYVAGDFIVDFSDYHVDTVEAKNDSCDVYFFTLPTIALAKLYDEHETALLQDNVRLFLKSSGVNKGVKKSLNETPELFLSYNNGLSAVCKEINFNEQGKISQITGLQIVNGGQTTASIHDAYKSNIDLSNSYVQVKLTHIKEEKNYKNMVINIARYANTQNKINNSDFISAEELFIEFEKRSFKETIPAIDSSDIDQKVFFERMRGQKKIELSKIGKKEFESKYVISLDIKSIAQIENIWEGYPSQAAKGGEKSLSFFVDNNKSTELTVDVYRKIIARQFIVKKVEEIMEQSEAPGTRYKTSNRSKNFGPIASSIKYYSLYAIFEQLKKLQISFTDIYLAKSFNGFLSDYEILKVIDNTFAFFDAYQTEINMLARNKETEAKYKDWIM